MSSFDTSIFSPDTYHAAILAALKQSAANQDTRYLDMLATMNGMGKKPVPDLQAGIVQHLPGVPFGYNNAHHAPTAEMLLPPPIYQAPVTKVVETNAPPPTQTFREPLPQSNDILDRTGGAGADAGGLTGNGLSTAGDQATSTSVADLSPSTPSETPATISPDETAATQETASPATQVATQTQPGFPGWDQVGNPAPNSNFNQNAPPSPPSNPLNEPDVSVSPTEVATTAPAPAPSINVDVNGNQVAAPSSALNSPGYQVSGLPSEMSTNPGDLGLNGFNQGVLDATSTNQASKGDSLNAMDVAPATTVTVAPPDVDVANSPAQNAISNAINNDQDVAGVPGMSISPSPSPAPPGYVPGDMAVATPTAPAPAAPSVANALAGLAAALSGKSANAPANAIAQEQENDTQAEQAAANVAALNSPGLVNSSLGLMNDVTGAMQASQNSQAMSAFNADPDSMGFSTANNAPGLPGGFMGMGMGMMGDPTGGVIANGYDDGGGVAGLGGIGLGGLSAGLGAGFSGLGDVNGGDVSAAADATGGFSDAGDAAGGVSGTASASADASGGFSGDAGVGIGIGSDAGGVSGDASGSAGVDAGGVSGGDASGSASGDGGW